MSRRRPAEAPEGLRITKLERDGRGVWTARVSLNGMTIMVHRHGGWMYRDPATEQLRAVKPAVAEALQAKVVPIENKERRRKAEREKTARKAAAA